MLKSTLGQVKLSIEVQYITVTQFSGFLEGLFSDSATVGPWGAGPHPPKIALTSKTQINEVVNEFFSTSNIFAPGMSTLNGQNGGVDRPLKGFKNQLC